MLLPPHPDLAWILFASIWLLSAPFSHRTLHREPFLSRLTYSLPLALGVCLVFARTLPAPLAPLAWLGATVFPASLPLTWTAFALTAVGIAFAVWARFHLGRLWSGSITFKEGHHLVASGPYALTRHPIYTGLLLAIIGTALAGGTAHALIGLPFVALGLSLKLAREDALLASRFPSEHEAYRRRVRRLVPYVY